MVLVCKRKSSSLGTIAVDFDFSHRRFGFDCRPAMGDFCWLVNDWQQEESGMVPAIGTRALSRHTLKDLAMVTLATAHSVTAACCGLQKSRMSQMLAVPLAVKEASQTTATPQLLSEKDLPQG
ncbi:hypothetical protein GH733_019149 [Mirounga leonina]|nr:hypothetical protein GH733_019149 [Mirounga leonina]